MKRIFSAFVLSAAMASTVSAQLSLSGSGTESNPYQVANAEDWMTLVQYIAESCDGMTGKYIQLTSDIDFAGDTIKPLGYDLVTLFNGELDGNGKTMSGYVAVADTTWYGALATMTGSSAYIHDITVAGDFSTSYNFCGGAVGFLYGTIDNVTNTGTVTSHGGQLLGGIVGGTGAGCTISNCSNKGVVSTDTYNVGGVVGRAWISTLKNCWNEGTVTSSSSQLGGVAAIAYGSTDGGSTLDSCCNKGTVISTGSSSTPYAAGVACIIYNGNYINCWNEGTVTDSQGGGYLSGLFCYNYGTASGYRTVMRDCYNTSAISGETLIAGILMYVDSSNSPLVDMYSCYNTGDITANAGRANGLANYYCTGGTYSCCYNTGAITGSGQYTSGLFGGYNGSSPSEDVATLFTKCYNAGNIISSDSHTGGIVGYVYRYTTVDSCYNIGDVSSSGLYIGGITSYLSGKTTSKLSNLYNAGTITSTCSTYGRIGGIVGYCLAVDSIVNVFNTGTVTSEMNYAGGISGSCSAAITNAYNTGDITAPAYVGGIVGYKPSSTGDIANVYNTGAVTATKEGTSYVGAIKGGSSTVVPVNSYYIVSSATGSSYDTLSVALTAPELAQLDLGEGWQCGDSYTFPRLATLASNDYAKAYAVAVIPADGDSLGTITQDFHVGYIDGITWTASSDAVNVNGNDATFTQSFSGTLAMTATCQSVDVVTNVECDVEVAGNSLVGSEKRVTVSEKLYNLEGQPMSSPSYSSGRICISVRTYDDGTTEAVKEVR